MKYKKMVANLEAAKRWWDAQLNANLLIEVNNHFEFKVK